MTSKFERLSAALRNQRIKALGRDVIIEEETTKRRLEQRHEESLAKKDKLIRCWNMLEAKKLMTDAQFILWPGTHYLGLIFSGEEHIVATYYKDNHVYQCFGGRISLVTGYDHHEGSRPGEGYETERYLDVFSIIFLENPQGDEICIGGVMLEGEIVGGKRLLLDNFIPEHPLLRDEKVQAFQQEVDKFLAEEVAGGRITVSI